MLSTKWNIAEYLG